MEILGNFDAVSLFRDHHHTSVYLIIHCESNFVNGTHLCKQYGKKFALWCNSDTCRELMQSWRYCYGTKKNCFMYYDNEYKPARLACSPEHKQLVHELLNKPLNEYSIQGTYCHHYFVPQLFQWLDPRLTIAAQHIIFRRLVSLSQFSNTSSDDDDEDKDNSDSNKQVVLNVQ